MTDYQRKEAEEEVGKELGFKLDGKGYAYDSPKPIIEALRDTLDLAVRLTVEKKKMEDRWLTLRQWLEHDRQYGLGHKVTRALLLMDELEHPHPQPKETT